jgi:Spy/CpxP family protein refolding chaperone
LLHTESKTEKLKGEYHHEKISNHICGPSCSSGLDGFGVRRWPGVGKRPRRGTVRRGRLFGRRFNLTAEQTAKINALREAHLRDVKPIRDTMFSKRGDLRLLWLQKNPDQEKIRQTQKEIRTLRDQMEDKKDTLRLEVLKVLTPEQQEKLNAYRPGRGFFDPGMKGGAGPQGGPGHHGGGPGMGMRGNW